MGHKGSGVVFANVEQALASSFLLAIFGDSFEDDDPIRALAAPLPVKAESHETGASMIPVFSSVVFCCLPSTGLVLPSTLFPTEPPSRLSGLNYAATCNCERHESTLQSIIRNMPHSSKKRTIL